MPDRPRYQLVFAPQTVAHVAAIARKHHDLIRHSITGALSDRPDTVGRSRKPLDTPGPSDSTWELRFGPGSRFRVFYDIDRDSRAVRILAVGVKVRAQLWVDGEEFRP